MIVEIGNVDGSRVTWSHDGKKWQHAFIDELIEAYEEKQAAEYAEEFENERKWGE